MFFARHAGMHMPRAKIRDDQEIAILSMAEGCSLVAPTHSIRGVLEEDTAIWDRFHELLIRHFVASKPEPESTALTPLAHIPSHALCIVQVVIGNCGADCGVWSVRDA